MAVPSSKKSLSEEDIKRLYITPAIEAKWAANTQIHMEHSFTDGRIIVSGKKTKRGKRKRADYLLSYKNNLPLVVGEARDSDHPVGGGRQQALTWA